MRQVRRHYGAHPLHLVSLLASFALAGYAAQRLVAGRTAAVIVWFVGAAVVHDLLLVPLYGIADGALRFGWRRATGPRTPAAWVNHVRIPALLSGLLLLVFLPSITRRSPIYQATTDLSAHRFLTNWLLVSAGLWIISAVSLAVRIRRVRVRAPLDP